MSDDDAQGSSLKLYESLQIRVRCRQLDLPQQISHARYTAKLVHDIREQADMTRHYKNIYNEGYELASRLAGT